MKTKTTFGGYDRTMLTTQLNYVWTDPQPPESTEEEEPYWVYPDEDSNTELINSLAEFGWRVDYIRQQINRLHVKPKGRRRVDLLEHLIETFLNPERFTRQLGTLNDEENRFYTYLLLDINLRGLQTQPPPIDRLASFTKSATTLRKKIINAGLCLVAEDEELFVPFKTFRLLQPRYIPIPTAPEPSTYASAPDPNLLLMQTQQLLALIQTGKYQLRQQLRWRTPATAYGRTYTIWPPKPEYSQRILRDQRFIGAIELLPPEPAPDDTTMDAWASAMGLPHDIVEFIYHLLTYSQIIRPGSPVTINSDLIQTWMMQSPSQQIINLYQFYRGISNWTEWWPAWRAGKINVGWNYQAYWGIYGVDQAIATMYYMLRWVLLDLLSYLPHNTWLSVDKVVEFLSTLFPTPQTHQYRPIDLICNDAKGHWLGFLRYGLLSMLQGPLYYMGFVDAAPNLEEMTTFRLRHLQDIHWDRTTELPVEKQQALKHNDVRFSQDDNVLKITAPAPAEFLIAVQQWARPGGLSGNDLLYYLDVRRLYNAFEQGASPESLAETWEKSVTFPSPPDIQAWWHYWWARYGHVRLYTQQTTLITRDEFTMQELQVALPTLRDSILALVTPRTALLNTEQIDQIVRDLERQGYMPKEAS